MRDEEKACDVRDHPTYPQEMTLGTPSDAVKIITENDLVMITVDENRRGIEKELIATQGEKCRERA